MERPRPTNGSGLGTRGQSRPPALEQAGGDEGGFQVAMETAELSQAAARGRSPAAIPQRSRKAPPLVRNAAHVGPGGVWAAGTRMEEEGAEVASGPAGSPEGPGTETGSPGLACGKRKMALHR